ncbi:hypothetical protein NEMBOFW57_005188 [Staphylotrichum longicolle]|uniref:Uncharacterized protein n=1 Tax=Staphylotrichum longicolle TaxID=669026 RepID=A0AAD4HVU7_9PEZI|nr:hypothetical protein NEMBOFW57_005188 [Staphylotrichum longicolle]
MCRYYAHQHACKHVSLSFAAFCDPASLIQNPCGQQHIWQTLAVEELCEDCKGLIIIIITATINNDSSSSSSSMGMARRGARGRGMEGGDE